MSFEIHGQTKTLRIAAGCLSLLLGAAGGLLGGEPASRGTAASATVSANIAPKPAVSERTQKKKARRRFEYWYTERNYADSPSGDFTAGEDLRVRAAALEALGKLNGAVVVVDTSNGRILTMVNQKLALAAGYMPCSTVKLMVGLAALNENIVEFGTKVWFKGGWYMTMVDALSISNNVYFDYLGEKLGFERVRRYARLFGFGEKSGWGLAGEQTGDFPTSENPAGVGRMTTFGDGISVTPLQLAAFMSALANGGTLYYLQHPQSDEAKLRFQPKVKRYLPVTRWLPEIEEGMRLAVKRGTGRNAQVSGQLVWGKTGTCSQYHRRNSTRSQSGRTRLGWFASYNEAEGQKLAVVVMLRGGSMITGPLAAQVAGGIYRGLSERDYFTSTEQPHEGLASLGLPACCEE